MRHGARPTAARAARRRVGSLLRRSRYELGLTHVVSLVTVLYQ